MIAKAHAVFWDMDGTLIDTEDLHYEVIRDWCAGHGYALTDEGNEALIAKTMQEKWQILKPLLGGAGSEALFRKECEDWYIERLTDDKGLERALVIVRALAEKGVFQACVSNGEDAVVRANVEILGLTEMFSFLVTGKDCEHGKPAPDPYLLAASKAGFEPTECIAVEDSSVGMAAARAAGCIVCGWPLDPEATADVDYLLKTGEEFPYDLLD
ncbi:MAG: HAD family phosphatase [Pseudodesulfovibrio sp.]